jgi:hypothetical protein
MKLVEQDVKKDEQSTSLSGYFSGLTFRGKSKQTPTDADSGYAKFKDEDTRPLSSKENLGLFDQAEMKDKQKVEKEFRCFPCPGWYEKKPKEIKGKFTEQLIKEDDKQQQTDKKQNGCTIF